MKLKDLLKEKERIENEFRKCEIAMQTWTDCIVWKGRFGAASEIPICDFPPQQIVGMALPPRIREIIINALQDEIDRLEGEEL